MNFDFKLKRYTLLPGDILIKSYTLKPYGDREHLSLDARKRITILTIVADDKTKIWYRCVFSNHNDMQNALNKNKILVCNSYEHFYLEFIKDDTVIIVDTIEVVKS